MGFFKFKFFKNEFPKVRIKIKYINHLLIYIKEKELFD